MHKRKAQFLFSQDGTRKVPLSDEGACMAITQQSYMGMDAYSVEVESSETGEIFQRKMVKLKCAGGTEYYSDAMTGSLYRPETGKCLGSDFLHIITPLDPCGIVTKADVCRLQK